MDKKQIIEEEFDEKFHTGGYFRKEVDVDEIKEWLSQKLDEVVKEAKHELFNELIGEMDLDKWEFGKMTKKFEDIYNKQLKNNK